MGYLTLDLECSECSRDLEFSQNKQVLTVEPCICKKESTIERQLEEKIKSQELLIQAQQQLIATYQEKTTL